MAKFGIMQGRLSPPQGDRLQFFPQDWQAEFQIAKDMGFDFIEWYNDHDGIDQLQEIWRNNSLSSQLQEAFATVNVTSMDSGKFLFHGSGCHQDLDTFISLLRAASALGIRTFNLPIMEDTAMTTSVQIEEVFANLKFVLGTSNKLTRPLPRIALETELPAIQLRELLETFHLPGLGVCYDIGNCTSYGFDCPAEIRELGAHIFSVHIKDRKIGTNQSVLLGTGDADFKGCFKALQEVDYSGNYILQAWRGDNYIEDARIQLAYAKNILQMIGER